MQCSTDPEAGDGLEAWLWLQTDVLESDPGKWLLSCSWKSTALKKQIISSMGSLQENDLNTLKEPVLSSSEFGPGFQFQFQNDKAGKKIMETLAPIFTETLRKIQFPRLNVFTGV